jgi:large subunit ribosomal protein L35
MPKMKSNRAAKKRFKLTASGKVKHKRSYARHILGFKSKKRKRHMRKGAYVHKSDEARARRLLGVN